MSSNDDEKEMEPGVFAVGNLSDVDDEVESLPPVDDYERERVPMMNLSLFEGQGNGEDIHRIEQLPAISIL